MPIPKLRHSNDMSVEDQRPKIFSVSEFNRAVKDELEERFGDVWIEGEISNYRGASSSGHCYFSLKDSDAQIDIVAFRGVMGSLKFKLEEGLQILVLGRASLYPQRGRFQVIANFIEPKGAGALQMAFEQLKKKLEAEGLFDPARKREIPALPQRIGIVTSPTGAAIKDILSVIDRRFANVEILIYPAKVQGEGAKEEIAEGIRYLNAERPDLEVLLVGRGGGSIEDLWAFNEEIVARAIAASNIPVISCVGHEIDFTIADFVADLRAPTPSAAAELVVKNKAELKRHLEQIYARLKRSLTSVQEKVQTLDYLVERMGNAVRSRLEREEGNLEFLKSKLKFLSPKAFLDQRGEFLAGLIDRMNLGFSSQMRSFGEILKGHAGRLEALSPLAVLSRGYSIAWALPQNKILKSASQVKAGDSIRVRLHEGELEAKVQEKKV